MTQPNPIKAALTSRKSSANDVLARANAVHGGTFADKDDYPNPPVDEATFKSQIDSLSSGITAAMDGGKKAIALRERLKGVVIQSLRRIGHYVEENCKDDMTTFLKSGFQPITTTRTATTPLSEWIRKIIPSKNSGQMEVAIVAQPGALSYQLRRAPVGQGGALGEWIEQPIGKTRPSTLVTGLTPGTAYAFQVRAVTNSGYTDWSQSIIRIAT